MNNLSQKLVFKSLTSVNQGELTIIDDTQTYTFGQAGPVNAKVIVKDPNFYRSLVKNGSLGAAHSFIAGEWETDDLTQLIRLFIKNEAAMNSFDSFFNKIPRLFVDLIAKIKKNTIGQARKYIHEHYDLGNEFFKTFLDDTLMYSCAIFESEDNLFKAQTRKLNRIIEQLNPQAEDHILEIGTGWGTLAIRLAQEFDCHITTTTISEEQYNFVQNRIKELGLEDKISLLNLDYRLLKGEYDKIVSIEMIEAVGHQYFDEFFQQCDRLLKPNGLLMIQAITINEQTYETAKEHVDFIKKYIFPGGCLPSIHRISQSVASHTKLQWMNLFDMGRHYVPTLMTWHNSFNNNLDKVKSLGFSDQFIRMWEFYFCYCAAGFQEDYISDVQLLLRKRN